MMTSLGLANSLLLTLQIGDQPSGKLIQFGLCKSNTKILRLQTKTLYQSDN